MEIFKIAAVGIICAVLTVIVRQYRPEIATFVQLAGVGVTAAMIVGYLRGVLTDAASVSGAGEIIDEGYIILLVKVLGIAVVTQVSADLCRDSGSSALANAVELAGRVMILILCVSLLRAVAELVGGVLQ